MSCRICGSKNSVGVHCSTSTQKLVKYISVDYESQYCVISSNNKDAASVFPDRRDDRFSISNLAELPLKDLAVSPQLGYHCAFSRLFLVANPIFLAQRSDGQHASHNRGSGLMACAHSSRLLEPPPGYSHSLKTCTSQLKTVQEIREAVKDATIIVVTVSPLDEVTLSPDVTPNLRLVVAVASGTDNIDRQKCNERRIPVLNSPNSNARSVAEHVIALYFASRRRLFRLHHSVLGTTEWRDRGTLTYKMNTRDNSPPLACSEETVGIIGYGAIGEYLG